MVAIVSGNSLGLSLSSLATLGRNGGLGDASVGRNGERAYVNIATGNLVVQDVDARLVGIGSDAAALRTYNSSGLQNDDNADNWAPGVYSRQMQLSGTVNTAGSTLTRTDADGAVSVYTWNASRSAYLSTDGAGAYDRIQLQGSTYVWTDGDSNATETYDTASGRLSKRTDAQGNSLSYAYNASTGLLTSMTDANGEVLYYDYSGKQLTGLRTVTADGKTLSAVSYSYDTSGRLSRVTVDLTPADKTDAKIFTTDYTYSLQAGKSCLASITQSDGNKLAFGYAQFTDASAIARTVLASVTDGLGNVTTYGYTNNKTTITDPLGLVTSYQYDAARQLTQITGPAVGGVTSITSFSYNANGDLTQTTDANGRAVSMAYDASGNQTLQRDAAGNTVTRSFDANNRLITETLYTVPDPDGAGAAQPGGAQTTRYVYDALNKGLLRFSLSAAGRVTENRYDGFGNRTSSIEYAANTYSLSGLAQTAVPTEATMSTWVASQNRALTARTDISSDARGQVKSTTRFAAVDAQGLGLLDGHQLVTQYVYDVSGLLLKTIEGVDGQTDRTYDGLGRLLSTIDAQQHTTINSYDDAGNRSTVALANGLSTISTYDKAGRLTSVQQTGPSSLDLGTTSYTYDNDGRLRMAQDATGARQWFLYDEMGRKVADVDAQGRVVEYRYNPSGQLTQTLHHASTVTAAQLTTLAQTPATVKLADIRPAGNTADTSNWNLFDAAGRLSKTVDALGYVVETRYDGASGVTDVIRYANAINLITFSAAPIAANATPVVNATADRRTRNFYDDDGLLRGTLDAEGYLTEMVYDAAGRLSSRLSYATQVPDALRSAVTLDALRPAMAAEDIRSHYVLNSAGQIAGEVDGEGYLTEHVYDARGNLTQSIRYATALSATVRAGLTGATSVASLRPTPLTANKSTSWHYNALNQLDQMSDPNGLITSYSYDAVGNLIRTSRAAGTEVRALTELYDLQGNLTGELDGVGSALLTGNQTQAQIDAIWSQYATRYTYDRAGRRTSQTRPGNARTLYFYNADNRLAYTIDALGQVEEHQYDGLGELTHVLRYGGKLPSTTLTSMSSLSSSGGGLVTTAITAAVQQLIAQGLATAKTDYAYDARGQLRTSLNPLQYLSSTAYNAFGEQQTLTQQLKTDGTSTARQLAYDRRGLLSSTTSDSLGLQAKVQYRYDAFGRRVGTTDANNLAQSASYDHLGRVVQTKDGKGAARSSTYDAFNRVLTQTDATQQTTRYVYDDIARSVTVTTPEGISSKRTNNAFGELASSVDGNAQLTSYVYDRDGNLKSITTPLASTGSSYDERDRLITSTDGNGVKTSYKYDDLDRIVSRTVDSASGGLNLVTGYAYVSTSSGSSVTITAPGTNGCITRNDYDLNGQLVATTVDVGGLALLTKYTFDGAGNTLTVTDPKGVVSAYVYDKLGRRTSEVLDQGGLALTKSYEYDLDGNMIASTDANGKRSVYAYDANNRQVYQVDPLGDTTYTEYDAEGRVQRVTRYVRPVSVTGLPAAPKASDIASRIVLATGWDQVQIYRYDKDGRVRYTGNAYTAIVRFTYDGNGNVIERLAYAKDIAPSSWDISTDPAPVADVAHDIRQSYTYDAANRVKTSNNNAGLISAYTYDPDGNLTRLTQSSTDAAQDQTTVYAYDGASRQTLSMDAVGAVTEQQYDAAGHVIKQIRYANISSNATLLSAARATPNAQSIRACVTANASADRVTYATYDKAARQTYSIDAEGGITRLQYDANGNVTAKLDYARAFTSAQITALGSPVTEQGLATLITSPLDRRTGYSYDAANRVRFELNALNYVTETRYSGLQTDTIRYKNALDVSKDSTPRAPLASATDDLKSAAIRDAAGRVVSSFDTAGVETYNTYDAVGQLATQTAARGLPEETTTRYVYDGAGRMRNKTIADGTAVASVTRYGYDALDSLMMEIDGNGARSDYLYDAAGRLIQTTNALGGITKTSYDAFGNAVKVTDPLGNVGYFYFDKLNRVTLQVDPEGYATQSSYWGAGSSQVASVRRYATKVAATTNELTAPVLTTSVQDALTTNLYDKLDRLTSATDAANQTEKTAYNADGNDGVAANRFDKRVTNKLGGTATYHYDQLGREISERLPVQAKNTSNQLVDVVNTYAYDAFNNRTQSVEAVGLNNRVTTYQYDKLGRQTARYGSAQAILDASFNPATVTPAEATRYDALGRVIETSTGAIWNGSAAVDGYRTTSYFDAAGNKTGQVTPSGAYTTYQYDQAGNLVRMSEHATQIQGYMDLFTLDPAKDRNTVMVYDKLGRLTQKLREAVVYWEPTFDSGGLILQVAPPSTVALQTLVYDANGNVIQETDARGNSAFTYYDKIGRKVLHIDEDGYAIGWDYADFLDTPTTEIKYAGKVSSYARQGDNSAPLALRDPATLRAGLSLTDARRTGFATDRLGRVLTQTVYGVATQSVDSSGGIMSNANANAVTTYLYDGLGNITQTRQLVSGTSWNQTDISYDKLGREISRIAPSYTDQNGYLVRPETDTEYDGLGGVRRSIQRGRDSAVETDDRITSYGYDGNGNRVSQSDPMGNLTIYEVNAAGQIARARQKNVLDADGNKRDIVRLLGYDAVGRISMSTVEGTGELHMTAYNVFGEISKQGTGDGWQEYTEYNTMGKVQRTNTGDGASKIYLNDRNGNATREIQGTQGSAVDMRTVQITAAAVDKTLNQTFSVYDKKNQLIRTVEAGIQYQKDTLSISGAFEAKLGDLYSAIQLDSSGGGAYTGASGSGQGSGFITTVIGSDTGGEAALLDTGQHKGQFDANSVLSIGGYRPSQSYSQTLTPFGLQQAFSGEINTKEDQITNGSTPPDLPVPFTLSRDAPPATNSVANPLGRYEVVRINADNSTTSMGFVGAGETINLFSGLKQSGTANFELLAQIGSETFYVFGFMVQSTYTLKRQVYNAYFWAVNQKLSCVSPLAQHVSLGNATTIKATRVVDGVEVPVVTRPAYAFGVFVWPSLASKSQVIVDFSAIPVGSNEIIIRGYDANGNIVHATDEIVNVQTNASGAVGVAIIGSPNAIIGSDTNIGTIGGSPSLNFSPSLLPAGTASLLVRVKGVPPPPWSAPITINGGGIALSSLPTQTGTAYEFILQKSVTEFYYGTYIGQSGAVALDSPSLRPVTLPSDISQTPALQFTILPSMALNPGEAYRVALTINEQTCSINIPYGSASFQVPWSQLKAQYGVSALQPTTLNYHYSAYIDRSGRSYFVADSVGTVTVGSTYAATETPTPAYPPFAHIALAGLASAIHLNIPNIGDVALPPTGDPRRWEVNGNTYLDLSAWLPSGAPITVGVSYAGTDANFSGTITLCSNGAISVSVTPSTFGNEQVTINVPGAKTLDVLNIGLASGTLQAHAYTPLGNGSFRWSLTADDRNKSFDVYYETTDANGSKYKSFGHYSVDGQGIARYYDGTNSAGAVAAYKPSTLTFRPPASTGSMQVMVRGSGSQGAWTTYNNASFTALGADRTLTVDPALRPASGNPAAYDLQYTAYDASGNVVSRGSGTFTVGPDGVVKPGLITPDRQPLAPITLYSVGRQNAAQMNLALTRNGTTLNVPLIGVWNATKSRMEYTWSKPFDGRVFQGPEAYSFVMSLQSASGTQLLDEVGDPLVTKGQMVFGGGSSSDGVQMNVSYDVLTAQAQVSHNQSYNAFGEISDEYDDSTLARAQAMVDQYNAAHLGVFTVNQSALHTTFTYNTLGKLIAKQDPETFQTLANGFVQRSSPITKYGYDLAGRMTVSQDANGNVSRQTYVGGGEQVGTQWAGDNSKRTSEYDIFGDARRLTNELGSIIEQDFDGLDDLVTVRRLNITRAQNFTNGEFTGAKAVGSTLTETYAYDSQRQRISHTDALNRTDKTFYDVIGRITQTRSAAGFSTLYNYQAIAAGASSDAILGVGGGNLGGYKLTTTTADHGVLVDKVDYFGHTTSHTDLGGTVYSYNYNAAGQLSSQTSTAGQNIVYSYLQNGYIGESKDLAGLTVSRYGYDDAGNRTSETYASLTASGALSTVYQASTIAYDEFNRMSRVNDGVSYKTHDVRYEYDAVGNRRAVIAVYWDPQTSAVQRQDDLWYTYDAANRFTTSMGSLTARGTSATDTKGQIVRGANGVLVQYDQAGQRSQVTDSGGVTTYTYTKDGYLEDSVVNGVLTARRRADASGRTLQYIDYANGVHAHNITTTTVYDNDNRTLTQTVSGTNDGAGDATTQSYYYVNSGDKIASAGTQSGAGSLARTVTTSTGGNPVTTTTAYVYQRWDSDKQASITSTQTGNPTPGVTTLSYDVNGHIKTADNAYGSHFQYFSDAQGLVLNRWESKTVSGVAQTYKHLYYYADGKRIGDVTTDPSDRVVSYAEQLAMEDATKTTKSQEDKFKNYKPVTSADFDQNYEPINASYPGATGSSYTVRKGDTLSSIAQSVWGDASMWYLIADANGLRGSDTLTAGQVLTIPNKVANIHNNANTFRPYNPGEVIGHIDPTLPAPPPPAQHGGGCGGIGMILMVVVAVVVTIYTAGAAAGYLAGLSSTFAAGTVASAAASLAIGAAAGSVASQLVGMATGNVKDFSWKAVGQAALGGAITAGVGAGLNTLAQTGGVLSGTALGNALTAQEGWMASVGSAVRAGAGTAVSMAIKGEWSWRAVAASSISAGAGNAVAQNIQGAFSSWDPRSVKFATTAISSAAGGWASARATGMSDTRSRVGQAFIQGLGQGISDVLNSGVQQAGQLKTQGVGPWSDVNYRNGGDIESDNFDAAHVAAGIRIPAPLDLEPQHPLPDVTLGQLKPFKPLLLPSANRVSRPVATPADYAMFWSEGLPSLGVEGPNPARSPSLPDSMSTHAEQAPVTVQGLSWKLGNGGQRVANMDWVSPNGEANPVLPIDPSAGSQRLSSFGVAARDVEMAWTNKWEAAEALGGHVLNWAVQAGAYDASGSSFGLDPGTLAAVNKLASGETLVYTPTTRAELGGYGLAVSGPAFGLEMAGALQFARGLSGLGNVGDVPRSLSEADFMGPMKPSNWDALTAHPDGHAFGVHGGGVTDADLVVRARTGVKPDGSTGPIPPLSSAFHSDNLLISTDQTVRNGGGLANAIARQPGQSVVRVETQDVGDLGMDLGYGYARIGATANKAANAAAIGPTQRIGGLNSAQGIYELNSATGVWETITVYPAPY
ncbi:MAG TPA: LysM peptidoglycan-binding domain-containing protein [Burkholderiaceae bacterium]|jgi:YD repeat-containing protein